MASSSERSRSRRLSRFSPQAYVEIGQSDADKAGIGPGDAVRVVSPAGEVTTVARLTDTLPDGMLFMPISFPATATNRLFGTALDARSKTPALKACAVRIERVNSDG